MGKEQTISFSQEPGDFRRQVARQIDHWYDIRIGPGSISQLWDINQLLIENPELNLLMYFNHLAYDDPLILSQVYQQIDPNGQRECYAVVNRNIFNPRKAISSLGIPLWGYIESHYGLTLSKVDTSQQEEKSQESQLELLHLARRIKKTQGVTLAIAPEGNLSPTGSLQEAQPGIVNLLKLMRPVIVAPIAISIHNKRGRLCDCDWHHPSKPKYWRHFFNPHRQFVVQAAEPFFVPGRKSGEKQIKLDTLAVNNGSKQRTVELLMGRLAEQLPEGMRSQY